MYDQSVVNQIKELLLAGLSYREIAAKTGVSRGTVAAVNRDQPRVYGQSTPQLAPPRRCQGCGHRVCLPCRICRARRHLKNALAQRRRGDGPPGRSRSRRPAA